MPVLCFDYQEKLPWPLLNFFNDVSAAEMDNNVWYQQQSELITTLIFAKTQYWITHLI